MRSPREVKRQEWESHWQVNTLEQFLENKPWNNEVLQNQEEALPPTRAVELKRAASSCKTSTRLGAEGFHPKVPLDVKTCEHIVVIWT